MRFFDLFIGAFTGSAYRYMRYDAKGLGLAYSFVLVAITTSLFTLYAVGMVYGQLLAPRKNQPSLAENVIRQIAAQWPAMTVTQGTIATAKPGPHTIAINATLFDVPLHGDLITIDTSGTTTHHNLVTPLLITRDEVIAKDGNEVRIRTLKEVLPEGMTTMILNRHSVDALAEALIAWIHQNTAWLLGLLASVLWVMLTGFYYIARLLLLTLLAGAGIMLGSLQRSPLSFKPAMRLAALSITPVAIADAVAFSVYATPLPNFVLLGLGLFMLSVAIRVTTEA